MLLVSVLVLLTGPCLCNAGWSIFANLLILIVDNRNFIVHLMGPPLNSNCLTVIVQLYCVSHAHIVLPVNVSHCHLMLLSPHVSPRHLMLLVLSVRKEVLCYCILSTRPQLDLNSVCLFGNIQLSQTLTFARESQDM